MPTVQVKVDQARLTERHYLDAIVALLQSGALEPRVRLAKQPFQYQVDLGALPQGITVEKGNVVVVPPPVRPGVLVVQVAGQALSIGRYLSQMALDYHPPTPAVTDMAQTLHRGAVLMLAVSLAAEQAPVPAELDVAAGSAAWPQLQLTCTTEIVTLHGPSWSPLRTIAARLGANFSEEE